MWDNEPSKYYGTPEDGLKQLKSEIESVAIKCKFELRVIGGLLKITPSGVYGSVMLELDCCGLDVRIYKHRTPQLTSRYKGRAVSKEWVVGFLQENTERATQKIEEQHSQSTTQNEPQRIRESNIESAHEKSGTDSPEITGRIPTAKSDYGYDASKTVCTVCGGDGGAAGQCWKCDGSGWA